MLNYSSYLIQRLKKPYMVGEEPKNLLQAICKNGLAATGISPEARKILNEVCIWDYMGSAEYEFGAIPKTLRAMAGMKLKAVIVPVPYYFKPWRREPIRKGKKIVGWTEPVAQEGTKEIGIICNEADYQEVLNRIIKLAVGDPSMHCKERSEFQESLAEYDYSKDVYGWLELDNGYMFFKDMLMFKQFTIMFHIQEPITTGVKELDDILAGGIPPKDITSNLEEKK